MKNFIGKYCIIRSAKAGVFAGTLKEKKGTEVSLSNARRLWYWEGAASLSQLAVEGVNQPHKCKFTMEVEHIHILEVCEIIPCTNKAIEVIAGVPIWKV